MTQHDRDFQKVLQALTAFDKKISTLEDVVKIWLKLLLTTLAPNKI